MVSHRLRSVGGEREEWPLGKEFPGGRVRGRR